MGQLIISDKSHQLRQEPAQVNVQQMWSYTPMLLFRGVQTKFYEKVYQYENYKRLDVTYKFFPDVYVHLELVKEKAKLQPGCPLILGNETVYGYKFKKNQKAQKVRSDKIYFRRKMFIPNFSDAKQGSRYRDKIKNGIRNRSRGRDQQKLRKSSIGKDNGSKKQLGDSKKNIMNSKEEIVRKLAELKLMSRLEIGAKLGRMIDGCDGILTEQYVEFYSEVSIDKGLFEVKQLQKKQKLCESLKDCGFKMNEEVIEMSYSAFKKDYIIKQCKKPQQQTEDNRSIKSMMRQFQEEINYTIIKLDGVTNMLSSIQNHLNHRDIQKAMEKFQQNIAKMEDVQGLNYAQQMAQILKKYNYYRNSQRQVSSYISTSRSSLAESRNLSASRFNQRSPRSDHPQDSESNEQAMRYSLPESDTRYSTNSASMSPRSTTPLRLSQPDSLRHLNNSPEQDYSIGDIPIRGSSWQSNCVMWESALERLKNYILDNDKIGMSQSLTCLKNLGIISPLQIEILFGQLLMQNAKTRHAKLIFQKFLYTKKGGHDYICSEVHCMLGYLSHTKGQQRQALCHYQKALGMRLRIRDYSRKTVLIYNNLAVLEYYMERYQRSLLYLHRGFRLGEYCVDYQLLMRSNCAMALAEQGQIKQAKAEMNKTYKNVEPYSNMEIVCKFYSNLGYFQFLDGVLQKARTSFDSACQIQQKCLIPNGYRPSLALHNNYAMYHHKRGEWRKAAVHLQKIQNQLNQLFGIKSVQLHFNFGKVYKQLYNHDSAIKHFSECRYLLMKLNNKNGTKYRQKVDSEIQKIQALRIDEVSEESSYANKLSKISRSLLSNKHIDAKMPN